MPMNSHFGRLQGAGYGGIGSLGAAASAPYPSVIGGGGHGYGPHISSAASAYSENIGQVRDAKLSDYFDYSANPFYY